MQRTYLKPLTALLICLALVLPVWGSSTALAGTSSIDYSLLNQTGPYATAKGAVYVRSGPGTGFFALGVLQQGEIVPILAVSPDGGWWYVNTRFGEGWVSNVAVTAANTAGVPVRDPGPSATVTGNVSVNVRNGPGPNAGLLGQIGLGTQVQVIGRNAEGTWLQVRWANGTGWVSAQYVTTAGVPTVVQEAVPQTANTPYVIVLATYLNVRTGPGINYASLGRVFGGDVLVIVGRSADNTWYQVETVYGTGWVSASYVAPRNEFGGAPVTTGTAAGAEITGPTAIINTGAVHLRSGPGPQYTSLGTLAGGSQGRIIGRSADWSWWLIESSIGNGWVSSLYVIARGDTASVPYVTPGGAATPTDGQGGGEAPAPAVTGPMAFVATGALNIRSGPNSAFSSLGSVSAGTRMPIIGQSPDRGWWQVSSPFGNGWISKRYARTEGDVSNIPVTQ